MANEVIKVRGVLGDVRNRLRTDLREMAEDVLQYPLAGRETAQAGTGTSNLDFDHLKTRLALRIMASKYALLSRIDKALNPPDTTA